MCRNTFLKKHRLSPEPLHTIRKLTTSDLELLPKKLVSPFIGYHCKQLIFLYRSTFIKPVICSLKDILTRMTIITAPVLNALLGVTVKRAERSPSTKSNKKQRSGRKKRPPNLDHFESSQTILRNFSKVSAQPQSCRLLI